MVLREDSKDGAAPAGQEEAASRGRESAEGGTCDRVLVDPPERQACRSEDYGVYYLSVLKEGDC